MGKIQISDASDNSFSDSIDEGKNSSVDMGVESNQIPPGSSNSNKIDIDEQSGSLTDDSKKRDEDEDIADIDEPGDSLASDSSMTANENLCKPKSNQGHEGSIKRIQHVSKKTTLDDFLSKDVSEPLFDSPPEIKSRNNESLTLFKNSLLSLYSASKDLFKQFATFVKLNAPVAFSKITKKAKCYPAQTVLILFISIALFTPLIIANLSDNNSNNTPNGTQGTLPASFTKEAQLSEVYYPSVLPEGYRIDVTENINEETIASYKISNGVNEIAFSQQINIPESAFSDLFLGSEALESPEGTIYIKKLPNNSTIAGLRLNEGTTILLNTQSNVGNSLLFNILSGVEKSKR